MKKRLALVFAALLLVGLPAVAPGDAGWGADKIHPD